MVWAPLSVAALAAITAACALPLVVKLLEVRALRRQCRRTRTLVLTYDDGPGAELTPAILKLLAAADARATFFPTTRSALANPELLSQVAAAGHEIGCHSARHLHAWKAAPRSTVRDIDDGFRDFAVAPSGARAGTMPMLPDSRYGPDRYEIWRCSPYAFSPLLVPRQLPFSAYSRSVGALLRLSTHPPCPARLPRSQASVALVIHRAHAWLHSGHVPYDCFSS